MYFFKIEKQPFQTLSKCSNYQNLNCFFKNTVVVTTIKYTRENFVRTNRSTIFLKTDGIKQDKKIAIPQICTIQFLKTNLNYIYSLLNKEGKIEGNKKKWKDVRTSLVADTYLLLQSECKVTVEEIVLCKTSCRQQRSKIVMPLSFVVGSSSDLLLSCWILFLPPASIISEQSSVQHASNDFEKVRIIVSFQPLFSFDKNSLLVLPSCLRFNMSR